MTERGFVEGRTNLPEVPVPGGRGTVPSTADPDRLAGLTTVYVQLVNSDPVRDILLRDGPVEGVVVAEQFTFDGGRGGLPMIRLTAAGPTAASAIDLAHRQTAAFQEYIASEQERSRIKPEDRVQIEVLRRAASAEVVAGRSFVGAGIAFIAILAVFVAAALILNNIRSRGTPDAGDEWRVPDYGPGAPDERDPLFTGTGRWSAPPYPSGRRLIAAASRWRRRSNPPHDHTRTGRSVRHLVAGRRLPRCRRRRRGRGDGWSARARVRLPGDGGLGHRARPSGCSRMARAIHRGSAGHPLHPDPALCHPGQPANRRRAVPRPDGGARGDVGVALFVNPAVHLRRSGYEAPIAAIVVSVMASVALNPGRVSGVSDEVVKDQLPAELHPPLLPHHQRRAGAPGDRSDPDGARVGRRGRRVLRAHRGPDGLERVQRVVPRAALPRRRCDSRAGISRRRAQNLRTRPAPHRARCGDGGPAAPRDLPGPAPAARGGGGSQPP